MKQSASALTTDERKRFLELVDRRFGIRGTDYAASRIEEAVNRALAQTDMRSATELLDTLDDRANPRWLFELVEHLTVGETYFMRDAGQIAALRETILPEVIGRRQSQQRLRLWSAGCSTGEEVYSLAILLSEATPLTDWDIMLIGTDVNRESLRLAREARYPAWSFRATSDGFRDRYFEPIEGGWKLIEPMRRMARFAWMNLGGDLLLPPAADLDLIMCRNVTIYFDDTATQRLYAALVGALAPGGWLMLGPSDPLPTDRSRLQRVDRPDAVLWRRAPAPTERPRATRHEHTIRRASTRRHASGSVGHERATDGAANADTKVAQSAPNNELEAGLLALEAGSAAVALDWLRRATFRDPSSAMAQFALARAYVESGDSPRALAALVHTRRLLAPLGGEEFVPGSDSMAVETLRQAVQTYLEGLA